MTASIVNGQSTIVNRLLNAVERIGNKLPDPITLFVIGALLVLIGSHLAVVFHWEVPHPTKAEEMVRAKSLLAPEGMRWVWTHLVENFTSFQPLGVVLVMMLGIGVAERGGLLGALMKAMVLATPRSLLTPAMVFTGMVAHLAADAGFVILPPLAALVFARAGRSPLVGMAAACGGVAAGFAANVLPSSIDALLQGITQESAQLIDPQRQVSVLCNYYFMAASTFILTLVGWAATKWFVERRYSAAQIQEQIAAAGIQNYVGGAAELTDEERRGAWTALFTLLISGGLILAMIRIEGWPLHGEYLKPSLAKPIPVWLDCIVPILFVLFLLPGIAFAIAAKTVRSDRDVARMLSETMATMGPYIVLAFVAGQFVAWFRESNLGFLVAIEGTAILKHLELSPFGMVLAIILSVALLDFVLVSASAKWALISPIFVPLFMGLGLSPELTQAAYRVGDSCMNPISPLNPYLVLILVFVQKYAPKAGFGTLVALMLPYTISFLIAWTVLLLLWMWIGLPLGPGGAPMLLEPMSS